MKSIKRKGKIIALFILTNLRFHVIGLAIAIAALTVCAPPVARAQLASGTDCGCTETGPFVDPNPGKAPFITANGDSAASGAKYHLTATPVGQNLPLNVSIVRIANGATVLETSGVNWGFSPDQDRFLIWTLTNGYYQFDLYDLSTATAVNLRTFIGPFTSLHPRFSKDGRFLLMAGLRINSGTEVQLEYVDAATGDVRHAATVPVAQTGSIEEDRDVVGWGYGPDPSRIVYSYLSGGQPIVALDNLDDASQTPLIELPLGAFAFWQFSPCGDVFGLVNQTAAGPAQVDLWRTRDGGPAIGSTDFANQNVSLVSLATTATKHQASIPGTTLDLAANAAGTACVVNAAPTADFSISGILEAGQTITFTDSSSDTDGTIASWGWTFGDGDTSSLQNPTHVYTVGGAYTVTLTVTDNGGKTANRTKTVTICSAAVASSGKLLYRKGLSRGDLYALNMDGSGEVRITNSDEAYHGQKSSGAEDADYSPDGTKIAWITGEVGFVDSWSGLVVSNADGSNKTTILPFLNDFMEILYPRWTPDGRSIAFYLRDSAGTTARRHGIYLIDADGSNLRLLHQATDALFAYPGGFSPVPSCSGGGDGCWTLAVRYNGYGVSQIYKIRGDGSGLTRITPGTVDHSPRYSPDGTKIAFVRGSSPYVLYVMNADGTGVLPLGTHQSNTWDESPIWSPDGSQIAFTRAFYPDGGSFTQKNIIVTNADGCHENTVAIGSPYNRAHAWAPGRATQGLGGISGRVFFGNRLTDPSAAGITVTAFWNGGSQSTLTAADGSYQITDIPIGVDITSISASFAGYVWIPHVPGYQFSGFTGQAYGFYLDMRPDRFTLQGTVRDEQGNPVPGIVIEASGQPTPVAPATTGSDGSFSFDLRPQLYYTVTPITGGYEYTPTSAITAGDYGAVLTQNFTATRIVPPAVTPPILFSSNRDSSPGNENIFSIYAAEPDGSGVVRLTRGPASDVVPAWSPDGMKIVFVRQTNGLPELHVMSKDGTGIVNLGIEGGWPAWSPGRTKFAFSRSGSIFVVDVDGSHETQLTADNDQHPAWSRDGKRIAFERTDTSSGEIDIYEVELATGNVNPLLVRPGSDGGPAWSPDGQTLLVSFTGVVGNNGELCTVSADGQTTTALGVFGAEPSWSLDGRLVYTTDNSSGIIEVLDLATGARQTFPKPQGAFDATPDWRIVPPAMTPPILFSSNRDSSPGNENIFSIYAAEPDGSGVVRLTRGSASDAAPAWSPDGKKIVFVRQTNGLRKLHVMPKDGMGIVNLGIEGDWPAWSPGRTKIAFSRSGSIFVVDVDGTQETQLTADIDQHPAWSRDGKRIAFERTDTSSGEIDIYEVELATGNVSPLLVRPGSDSGPAWSPDGQTLVVSFTGAVGDNGELYTVSADGQTTTALGVFGTEPTWSPDGRLAYTTDASSGIIEVLDLATGFRQTFPKPQGAFDATPDWLTPPTPMKGDMDGNGLVDLADAILSLRVMAVMNPAGIVANYINSGVDVNNDNKIGLEEAIYIMQKMAEMR